MCVRFMADEVALGFVFLRVLRFLPSSIISSISLVIHVLYTTQVDGTFVCLFPLKEAMFREIQSQRNTERTSTHRNHLWSTSYTYLYSSVWNTYTVKSPVVFNSVWAKSGCAL